MAKIGSVPASARMMAPTCGLGVQSKKRLLASVPNVRIALSQFPVDGTTLDGLIEAASDAFDDDTNLAASGQSFD